jgi:hypothetical protein
VPCVGAGMTARGTQVEGGEPRYLKRQARLVVASGTTSQHGISSLAVAMEEMSDAPDGSEGTKNNRRTGELRRYGTRPSAPESAAGAATRRAIAGIAWILVLAPSATAGSARSYSPRIGSKARAIAGSGTSDADSTFRGGPYPRSHPPVPVS